MRRIIVVLFLCGYCLYGQTNYFPLTITGGKQWQSSNYGPRSQMLGGSTSSYHAGIDYACRVGTPVLAVAAGVVVFINPKDSIYGKMIVLRLVTGEYVLYGHLSKIYYVQGTVVKAQQVIGLSGNTGMSSGPHLHIAYMINPTDRFISPIGKEPPK